MTRQSISQRPSLEDVEWLVEWQLSVAFPWLPLRAAGRPNIQAARDGWDVTFRVAGQKLKASLPLREVSRLVQWCHARRGPADLARPRGSVRLSIAAVRRALAEALSNVDPLRRMGYSSPVDAPPERHDRS